MLKIIARRVAILPPLLLVISFMVFALTAISTTNPAEVILGPGATKTSIRALSHQLGLNQPLLERYWSWLDHLFHGSLGLSWYGNIPVTTKLAQGAPITAALVLSSLFVIALVAIPAGLFAGMHPGGRFDRVAQAVAGLSLAMPEFWVGLILILIFSEKLHFLPGTGPLRITSNIGADVSHLVLPVFAISLPQICALFRLTQASAAEITDKEYLRTARAGGISNLALLWIRLAKNALVPSVTLLALQLGRLIGIAAVVESVFGMQGIGSIAVQAALGSDIPTVLGVVLVTSVVVMFANLLADVVCFYLSPVSRRT